MKTKIKIKKICSLFAQERSDWFANSSAERSSDRVVKQLTNNSYKLRTEKGFTLLIAVLISGVLLAIGLAIFNITIKEILLSSSGRDSQFAFYAADSGIECALYWDQKEVGFATSTTSTISCNDTSILDVGGVGYDTPMVFQFEVGGFCSVVSVIKSETHPRTKIESKGYNTTCDNVVNPRRIERAIRVTY